MLENTDKAVADLLKMLPDMIKGAETHLPDIAQQMLIQGAYNNQVSLVASGFMLFIGVLLAIRAVFSRYNEGEVGGFLSIFIIPISLFTLVCSVSGLHKMEHAPKLYLLEKVMQLKNQ